MNHPRRVSFLLMAAWFAAAPARAAVLSVTTTADTGPGSLRAALAEAADGDTIDATAVSGTVLLTSGELLVTRSITLLGPGPGVLAVDGNAAHRVFHVLDVAPAPASISGLTITNGRCSGTAGAGGAGLYNDHSTLTVSNCVLTGNSVNNYYLKGGGIYNGSSTLNLVASTLSSNSANTGGAICNESTLEGVDASLSVSDCIISSNIASLGGGVCNFGGYNATSMLWLDNCVLSSNSAYDGGAILNDSRVPNSSVTLWVSDCIVNSNTASFGGGLFNDCAYNDSSMLWVSNCTVSFNTGTVEGGGIGNSAYATSTLLLNNCTVSSNSAPLGGGIYNDAVSGTGAVMVAHCLINGNVSETNRQGGGICTVGRFGGSARLTVVSSALNDNTAPGGLGGGLFCGAIFGEGSASLLFSRVSGNSAESGGGLCNDAEQGNTTLLVSNSMVSFNTARTGGGILNSAAIGRAGLAIANSTIASNAAGLLVQGILAFGGGGGIFNVSVGDPIAGPGRADVGITNSTLSGNATGPSGSALYNYSIYNGTGTVGIVNSTLSGNVTPNGGADIYNAMGALFVGSTILNPGGSGPSLTNRFGTVTSLGFNLASDAGDGFLTNATDLINTDPMLGPLQDNGGPTFTHALLAGSPAIDQGKNFSGAIYDQRGLGYARRFDDLFVPNAPGSDGTDIGAFEAQKTQLSPAQALQRILDLVNAQCPRPRPLRATLDAALASLDRGDTTDAVAQLQAFENQVRAQVAPTDPTLAETLLLEAQQVIAALMDTPPLGLKTPPEPESINSAPSL